MAKPKYMSYTTAELCKLLVHIRRSMTEKDVDEATVAALKAEIREILEALVLQTIKYIKSALYDFSADVVIRDSPNSKRFSGNAEVYVQEALVYIYGGQEQLGVIARYLDKYDDNADDFLHKGQPLALTTFIKNNAKRAFTNASAADRGITTHEQIQINRYNNARKELEAEGNDNPTSYEIGEKMTGNVRIEAVKRIEDLLHAQSGQLQRDNDDIPDGYGGADYETPEDVAIKREQSDALWQAMSNIASTGTQGQFAVAFLSGRYGLGDIASRIVTLMPHILLGESSETISCAQQIIQRSDMERDSVSTLLSAVKKCEDSQQRIALCEGYKTNNLLLKQALLSFIKSAKSDAAFGSLYRLIEGLNQGDAKETLDERQIGKMFGLSGDVVSSHINNALRTMKEKLSVVMYPETSLKKTRKIGLNEEFFGTDPLMDWSEVFIPAGVQDSLMDGMLADRGDLFDDIEVVEAAQFDGDITF